MSSFKAKLKNAYQKKILGRENFAEPEYSRKRTGLAKTPGLAGCRLAFRSPGTRDYITGRDIFLGSSSLKNKEITILTRIQDITARV